MSPARMYSFATSTAERYAPLGMEERVVGRFSPGTGGSTATYANGRARSATASCTRTTAASYASPICASVNPATGTLSSMYTRWRQWSKAASEPMMLMEASGKSRSSRGTFGRSSISRTTS